MANQLTQTPRGFQVLAFSDCNGNVCSLQQSSAIVDDGVRGAGASALWLGRDDRMHLSRDQVIGLTYVLGFWAKNGYLPNDAHEMIP